ncbi:MAG: NAD-dependent epimerase/dehydratase family protein [Rhizomicrobium sp.]
MAQTKLLVTGATGLVGSHLCHLAASADTPRVVWSGTSLVFQRSKQAAQSSSKGDITDKDSLLAAMQGVAGIIHTAGAVGGPAAMLTEQQFIDVNYGGVVLLLDLAKRAAIERVVCISSTACLDDAFTMSERSPIKLIRPTDSPYVRAKRAALYESLCRAGLGQHVSSIFPRRDLWRRAGGGPGLRADQLQHRLAARAQRRTPVLSEFPADMGACLRRRRGVPCGV